MLALLVYGSSRRYADAVPAWPLPPRRMPAPTGRAATGA
jgi:hypothetical protein